MDLRPHFAGLYGKETVVESRVRDAGKDFMAVAEKHGVTLDDVVVIGDGHSEMNLCTWYHIDLIRVPPMDWTHPIEFSFEMLMF